MAWCGVDASAVNETAQPAEPDDPQDDQTRDVTPSTVGLHQVQLAVETDNEYYVLFGDANAAAAYVVAVYGAVSDIYIRDVDAEVTLTFVRIWDNPDDIFNDPDPLGQFLNYWNANMGSVVRDAAQLFSGRRNLPAGGVAYLAALCSSAGYSWTGYALGHFADLSRPSAFCRDIMIPAHELGHNCASAHTQDYGLDTCHIETSAPRRGSIMSYCGQTFTGGDANHDLWFHTVCGTIMKGYIATRSCGAVDCNQNGVSDALDIGSGTSADVNGDGVPDECQDCNANGILDPIDIQSGGSLDRNRNDRPDECEPDCNGNGVPDDLDLLHRVVSTTFTDNFEANLGWTVQNTGITAGAWERGVPANTPSYGSDPLSDGDGSGSCYVTQNSGGSNGDVDGGTTRLVSPRLDFSAGGLSFGYLYFLRLGSNSGADRMVVEVNANDGVGTWTTVAVHRYDGQLLWRSNTVDAAALLAAGIQPSANMRVRFSVNDADPDNTVEAGLDGFYVGTTLPPVSGDADFNFAPDVCEGDCDGDGTLDYVEIIANMALDLNRNVVLDSCEDCDGDGVLDLAELNHSHNVWVADRVSTQLREYLATYGTETGGSSGGTVSDPQDLIITADRRVLVASRGDNRIAEFDVSGAFVRTLVASGAGGLAQPAAMTIAPWGNLLVASSSTNSVLEYDIGSGAFVRAFVTAGAGGLTAPFGLAFRLGGNLFVTSANSSVLEFDAVTGGFVRVFVAPAAGGLSDPRGLLWLPSGNLLVASRGTDQVLEYNGATGAFVRQFSQVGDGNVLTLDQPWCIRLGPDGDVYVSRAHDHAGAPIPPPGGGQPLHLSNARIYRFDVNLGYFVLCYVMGVNSNLVNPTGFDFVPDAGTDCNNNQLPDNCDIASGRSADVNDDGIPDECQNICIGDLNADGVIDLADLAMLLSNFGTASGAAYSQGDLDGDDSITLADLTMLLSRFGTPC
ncbi:MAG: hypothetical protein HZB38_10980 [Planctomycetes bacterium]|nr:hypothetical protein [Planctomycetota bacterium]